ncbi:hypothetical protein ACJIZ3_014777 [Penstemon smallii]|uniref:BHLH domain-containing protein n=1 Tax=Penstemon smallii TaxID=265156 RepID=A0ABD3RLB8_9LAMI
MVRTVNHVEDDETLDSSSPTENKRVDKKGNALRSKHSETEQRRRSKINERFQILRDLIPENDQKRDQASFLLEVIQYIQFLHEKLQMYEGSCQGWSQEPTKLKVSSVNSGPIESFIDQSHLERQLSSHEHNDFLNPTLLSNAQNSVELDMTGATLYKQEDDPPVGTNNMPVQPPVFEGARGQLYQGSFPDAEQVIQQPQSNFWQGRSFVDDCSVPLYSANGEELKKVSGEASISSAYSQGLLNSLRNALESSGVDLSQANISVQLDVGKQTNAGSAAETIFNVKDHENRSGLNSVAPENILENYEHPHKRLRTEQN